MSLAQEHPEILESKVMTPSSNPFVKVQLAFWEGWTRAVMDGLGMSQRIFEHQIHLLDHHGYFRFHNVIPQGADWFDHYGKRNHDVDVEKV